MNLVVAGITGKERHIASPFEEIPSRDNTKYRYKKYLQIKNKALIINIPNIKIKPLITRLHYDRESEPNH